ncbi:MAG: hypothetical protein EOP42_25310 [Sphingobacteriaceae bacterium]|nr:MAG: hypothetical protein EOP42_25310 [Sphingobacteriaceae bacterium]
MKFLFFLCLFFIVFNIHAQQITQYNTGTLFDSFENPAQRAFIPDSSRQFAFNFFVPNFSSTGSFTGNGQNSVRSLIKNGTYNSIGLTSGLQKRNNLNIAANNYWFMLKMYKQLDGDIEIGISAQTKAEGRGSVTDETLLLLDSYKNLNNGTGNKDVFNNRVQAQAYHQFSLTFRQKVSPAVAFGLKLSTLFGIYYENYNAVHSGFTVENDATNATLFLQGKYASSYNGTFGKRDFAGYKNPGASVSFGMQAQLENGIVIQGNVKDLGFIRWNKNSVTSDFNGTQDVDRITVTRKNDSRILTEADSVTSSNLSTHAFYAPVNGKADLAFSKKITVFTTDFYYTPTLIVSKNLFYDGLTGAFVNHFTYKNLWFTALASYNDLQIWNAGAQIMFKSPNAEFFIGTEQLFKSARFFNISDNNYNSSGISAVIGFSAKFGRLIEHPGNANYIPMGNEKGFFNKMWLRIFKRSNY